METTDYDQGTARKSSGLPWVLLVLVLALGAAAGYFGYGLYQKEKVRADAALKAGDEAAQKANELGKRVAALESDLKAKADELAQLKATYDSINSQLQGEIAKGEVELTQQGEKITVEMVDEILFDSGKADVSTRGQEVLQRVGNAIGSLENKLIQVSGHTDDSPPVREVAERYPTNWELSAARAVNVVRFLAEKGGVPAKRLLAAGYGQFHPIASNRDGKGRAKNRRIEILLTPEIEQKTAEGAAAQPAAGTASGATNTADDKQSPKR
jgi:chemotaxis protein MotB